MGALSGNAGQGGEALELALGLLRAPALRTALRHRPLPDGIGEVLAIASESPEALRGAMARTGRDGPELVEASRFFIQQVLLADGSNAYRTLGAEADAGQARLRDHHRLLLRWLHPDRSREDAQWDSALSTRVNQAWNQLRTPGARARYDAELAEAAATAPPDAAPVAARPIPAAAMAAAVRPYAGLEPPKPIPTGPIAVAFLAIACLGLAWLAVTRDDRLEAQRDASRFATPAVDVVDRMAKPLPHVLPEVDVRAPAPLAAVAPAPVVVPELAAESFETGREPGESAADVVEWDVDIPFDASAASAAPPPMGMAASEAVAVADDEQIATTQAAPALPPAPAVGRRPSPLESLSTSQAQLQPQPQPQTPTQSNSRSQPQPQSESQSRPVSPSTSQTLTPSAPAAASPGATDPLALFREAESAIASVTRWLGAGHGAQPLWLDLPVSLEAAALRQDLHARHEAVPRGRLEVAQPNWTLGTGRASMSGAYRYGSRRDVVETGMLHVQLARRGEHWRIAALQLEPAQ